MIDWTESMTQTFEYYIVDPNTWRDKEIIKTIKSSSITWDSSKETLASATFDLTGTIEECYIRIYLIAIQNGVKYKIVLGTFLVQTPSTTFDGRIDSVSVDAYSPLLELKENPPPLQCTVSYTHGYYPIHIGNCVRLNYKRANLIDVKARVISQQINCSAGCSVTEKAVFTANLWG